LYHLAPLGLAVFLFYLSVVFPFALSLVAIPIYIAIVRHGRGYGIVGALGAAMAVYIISGVEWALVFTSVCVLMALAAGEAFKREFPMGKTVATTALLPFLGVIGVFVITAYGSGASLSQAVDNLSTKAVEMMVNKQVEAGGDKELVEFVKSQRQNLVWIFSSVFPALLLNMTLFLALLNFLVARSLSIRFDWKAHMPQHDLSLWRAPEKLAWVMVGGGALSLTGLGGFPAALGLNIVFVLGMVYSIQGLSTAHYLLLKSNATHMVKTIAYILILIAMPWSVLALWSLGLVDALVDLRKMRDLNGISGE